MTRHPLTGSPSLQRDIDARENCLIDVLHEVGHDDRSAAFKIYVDRNVRETPMRFRDKAAATIATIPVQPGEHVVQVRDYDVASPGRRESNAVRIQLVQGQCVKLVLRSLGQTLELEFASEVSSTAPFVTGRALTESSESTFFEDSLAALGKLSSAAEVKTLLRRVQADDAMEEPPYLRYVIARKDGVSLVFESERLVDVQVQVESTRRMASCSLTLPFGLQRGMHQADVHLLLGDPASSDRFDSRYFLEDQGARLFLGYASETGLLRYVSVAPIADRQ